MQKQKKNKKIKIFNRYRFFLKNNKTILNPTFALLNFSIKKNIIIRISQNNIFCTLITKKNNTLFLTSSGIEKTPVTKKTLKFNSKIIISSFIKKIQNNIKNEKITINIIAPLKIKKLIINILKIQLKNVFMFLNTQPKKSFNGCKSKKKKRKKQRKGLRIYN